MINMLEVLDTPESMLESIPITALGRLNEASLDLLEKHGIILIDNIMRKLNESMKDVSSPSDIKILASATKIIIESANLMRLPVTEVVTKSGYRAKLEALRNMSTTLT